MVRKVLLLMGLLLLLMAFGVYGASGQDGEKDDQFSEVLIFTTATDAVGVGTYVAGEAYAVPAGEDPAAQPVQALILPYGIYPNMHVEVIEDFQQPEPAVEGFTFEWSLKAPEGSSTELIQGTVAIFMADVEGQYELTLKATDANGNSGEATWVVTASTYIGVGAMDGLQAQFPACSICHADQASAWSATAHANMFTRAIDGQVSDHYGPDCISCHTTGFNNRPEAVNGGFDDVARDAGWTFPEELTAGNWDAMVAEFPEVAKMANIQCESCHGPGAAHAANGGDKSMIGIGLDYGTCAQCHAEEPYHVFSQQWEVSAHADKNAQAFWYPIGEERLACVGCHSGAGYIDAANGVPMEERRSGYQTITCAVCHDPHHADNPNQLRIFDSVTLPNGTDVTAAGPAATCMTCHNSRVDAVASVEGERFSTPHYSVAAELISNTGGYTWGETVPVTRHGQIIQSSCVSCHMAATPGMDDDGNPLPGHNTVGQHTFAMVSPVDGTENVAVCQGCHSGVESFAFDAAGDYDGDGAVETNQDEVAGLLEVLQGALEANGVVVLDHYPYFELPEDASVDVKGAVFNFKMIRDDQGSVVHNLKYSVGLLQLSYAKLTGEPVPGATLVE